MNFTTTNFTIFPEYFTKFPLRCFVWNISNEHLQILGIQIRFRGFTRKNKRRSISLEFCAKHEVTLKSNKNINTIIGKNYVNKSQINSHSFTEILMDYALLRFEPTELYLKFIMRFLNPNMIIMQIVIW